VGVVVDESVGPGFLRKGDRDDQEAVPLGSRCPCLAIFRAIAARAMLHDDDRLVGIVTLRPETFQHQRPLGVVTIEVRDARATGLRQHFCKLVEAHR
jgi:hypothetical protein